jgi:hypothetical protein
VDMFSRASRGAGPAPATARNAGAQGAPRDVQMTSTARTAGAQGAVPAPRQPAPQPPVVDGDRADDGEGRRWR